MKKSLYLFAAMAVFALPLHGALGLAQSTARTTDTKPREAASGHASGRQDQSAHASGATATMTVKQTPPPAGGSGTTGVATSPVSNKNSGHANEQLKTGNSSQYEPKNKATTKLHDSSGSLHEYKDGEDGTVRSRPGNHKPGSVK